MNEQNMKILADYLVELTECMVMLRQLVGTRFLAPAVIKSAELGKEVAVIANHAHIIAAQSTGDRKYLAEIVQDKATEIQELRWSMEENTTEKPVQRVFTISPD